MQVCSEEACLLAPGYYPGYDAEHAEYSVGPIVRLYTVCRQAVLQNGWVIALMFWSRHPENI